jgi:hypothetical protein
MLANERKQQFFQTEIFFTKNSIFLQIKKCLLSLQQLRPSKGKVYTEEGREQALRTSGNRSQVERCQYLPKIF